MSGKLPLLVFRLMCRRATVGGLLKDVVRAAVTVVLAGAISLLASLPSQTGIRCRLSSPSMVGVGMGS